MKAQKWLGELERLSKAATQGPWINPGRAYIAQQYGAEKVIADCKSKEFGQAVKDAAYIVAACNAVPRLVEMLNQEAYLLECPYEDEKCPYVEGKTVSCADCKLQYLYERTEPKE